VDRWDPVRLTNPVSWHTHDPTEPSRSGSARIRCATLRQRHASLPPGLQTAYSRLRGSHHSTKRWPTTT
jgi:hypothetical protein